MNMANEMFEKFKAIVSSTTKKAVKISGEAIDYTKIKLKITELKSKLDEKYAQIGLAVYEGTDTESIDDICDEITTIREEIDTLNAKLSDCKNQKTCPVCNTICEKNDEFCRKCGSEF